MLPLFFTLKIPVKFEELKVIYSTNHPFWFANHLASDLIVIGVTE